MRQGATKIPQVKRDGITKGLVCIEKLLTENEYIAGDTLTLADFSVWSLLEAMVKLFEVTAEDYPKIFTYIQKMREELPFKELVMKNALDHYNFIQSCIERNKAAQKS